MSFQVPPRFANLPMFRRRQVNPLRNALRVNVPSRPAPNPLPLPSPTRLTTRLRSRISSLRKRNFSFTLSNYYNYCYSVLFNSSFIIYFAISLFLLINYHAAPSNSFVLSFTRSLSKNFNISAEVICKFVVFAVSALPFIPIILSVAPSKRLLAGVVSLLYYNFIPELTHYEYLLHSVFVMLFLKTNNSKYKMASAIALVIVYFAQFTIPLSVDNSFKCTASSLNISGLASSR